MRTIVLVLGTLAAFQAKADFLSEFGFGYKLPNTTSVVLLPECSTVLPTAAAANDPGSPFYGRTNASCGGDNPAFIGYPIKWESDFRYDAFRIGVGWFHFSHWNDGGRDRETHMDMLTVTFTVNWSNRREKRR